MATGGFDEETLSADCCFHLGAAFYFFNYCPTDKPSAEVWPLLDEV